MPHVLTSKTIDFLTEKAGLQTSSTLRRLLILADNGWLSVS